MTTAVTVWRAESPAYLKHLRGRQLGAPDCLHATRWRIHVPMVRSGAQRGAGGALPHFLPASWLSSAADQQLAQQLVTNGLPRILAPLGG